MTTRRTPSVPQVPPAEITASPVELPGVVNELLAVLDDGAAERGAAFRALRRRLAEQKDPRVILVTSAQDGEGKTACAANLALALAETGRLKVLLVEANIHRPKLAEIFGFKPSHCLLEQLAAHRQQLDAPWFTSELRPIGLHVLAVASEVGDDRPLHGPTFSESLARWRLAFDYVVVDGPAVLTSCDISVIHDSVDTILMVLRSGMARNRTVRRALEQISGEMLAGLVLMDSAQG